LTVKNTKHRKFSKNTEIYRKYTTCYMDWMH